MGKITQREKEPQSHVNIMFQSLAAQFKLLPQHLHAETMFQLQQVIFRQSSRLSAVSTPMAPVISPPYGELGADHNVAESQAAMPSTMMGLLAHDETPTYADLWNKT